MSVESINLLAELTNLHPVLIALAIVWSLIWKGFALWKSAELRHKYWFIAILVVNTLGLLEIIYLFFVAKKYKVEFVEKIE